ncbi:NAD(P)H-binding protein [Nonomuraea sediminis]|uniref:NAD(P)H-binding protein n=1 Tax=Nonomuraea sediminis TaxID=2835864 RepID=UPI001BDDB341|nr:NAD(P)H-binding protein [Nonomuraea sediminis]
MSVILVTGATGNAGRQVVRHLLDQGVAVRGLARDPGRAADGGPAGALQVVAGDLARAESLAGALGGVETVFLVWPFLTTEGAPAVLDLLKRHVRRVVYLSSSGVRDGARRQTDPINQLHADMEALIEGSRLEWTVLRSNTIATNALGWAEQIRTTGVVRGPDIAATAVIHEGDIGAVAARVLTSPGHEGARHVLTGPEVVSRAEQVQAIGDAIGRVLRFEPVALDVARERMLADGRPPALVEALLASAESRPESRLVTTTVEHLTGTPPRPFTTWAHDNAHAFR